MRYALGVAPQDQRLGEQLRGNGLRAQGRRQQNGVP
jgi:hypothetical protein